MAPAPEAAGALDPVERHRVLIEWNATQAEYPLDRCLHELLEEQATRTPQAVAVEFEGQSLTYAGLHARANQLAHHLRTLGVGPEVLVGICAERSLEMVIGLLGTLKAGGAYVPLDPDYPPVRLDFMVRDSGVRVLLAQDRFRPGLTGSAAHCFSLDADWPLIAAQPATPPRSEVRSSNLAYMIYTSGSTGQPKGALNAHAGIVNRLLWMQAEYHLTPADAVLQKTSFGFDVSVWELFWPLLSGARLVLARPQGQRDPAYLVEVIRQHGVTVVHFVPSLLDVFLESLSPHADLPLRDVFSSGEALSFELQQRFFTRFRARLHNLYGPTECAVDVTHWTCEPEGTRTWVPIGRPVANTQAYVLDARGEPTPIGTPGELCIGGVQVGRGYWKRPELTAERFIPDPFSPRPGARLYRTGDRCRWTSDGVLEYLGRLDDQVKIRGFRVELGEIEAALRRHPSVRAAVVLAQPDSAGGNRLVAYVAGGEGLPDSAGSLNGTLRSYVKERLPEYMVPSAYVVLEQLPLTPNGKVDRQALAALPHTQAVRRDQPVAPRTPQEELVCRVWEELLGRGDVGVQDDFFELGGHSLLAMRVAARLAGALQRDVPVAWCLEHRTLEALARALAQADGPALSVIPPVARNGPLPLSHEQERLWYLHRLDPDECTYNVPLALRLEGVLDLDALEGALATLTRRHEMLRTSFVEVGGQPLQQVHEELRVPIEREDLRALAGEQQQARLAKRLAEEARRPFDLGKVPLLRVCSFRVAEQEHVVLFTAHHIVCDEWSLRLLMRELEAVVRADGQEPGAGLPSLGVQYADYASWQRQQDAAPEREADRRYWRAVLADAPARLQLPADRPHPPQLSGKGQTQQFTLAADLVRAVERVGYGEGASAFVTWLTLYRALLERWSGQTDVVIGTPLAFRHRPELQGVFGFFLNMLPLRGQNVSDLPVTAAVAQARQQVMEAFAHGQLPFAEMARINPGQHLPGDTPLFSTSFVFLDESAAPPRWLGCQTDAVFVETSTSKFELMLSLERQFDGALRCAWEFSTDLLAPQTVGRLHQQFERLAGAVVSCPPKALGEQEILSPEERHRVLVEWNATQVDYPRDIAVHELFAAQVARAPEAVALIEGGRCCSYGELNRRAELLARHLRNRGVTHRSAVALHLERSIQYVIGVLAVLKAGGCYVPLAIEHPTARRRFMLEHSRAMIVLGHGPPPDGLCPSSCAWFDLEQGLVASPPGPDASLPPTVCGEDPAYVMYTSGSTGEPKGVVVPHRAICRLVHGQSFAAFGPGFRTLLLAQTAFDASTFELWGPLLHGGSCVVCRERMPPLDTLESLLRDHEVNCLWLTASLFNQIVDLRPGLLSSVAHVLTGGEALSPAHVRRAQQCLPGTRLTNGYGPTECTTFACTYAIASGGESMDGPVPIGRPIANTRAYVLDERRQPVGVGSPGELYLGGDGLACGYLERPDLTAERFIPDPFRPGPNARLYRTGDRCRWTTAGVLEFLGRRDDQVKIRGFRVELGEIEAVLRRHPAVRTTAVLARPDAAGNTRLIAYVAGEKGPPDPAESLNGTLRGYLKERLPEYMVPSAFVALEQLPLTPNGKLDRKALAELDGGARFDGGAAVPPANATEQAVAQVWSELLGLQQVGVTDDFFDAGGHSLLAVRLLDRLHKGLGVLLPLPVLLAAPRVRSIAAEIDRRRGGRADVLATKPPKISDMPPMFLLGWYLHAAGFFPEPELLYVLPFPELGKDPEQWRVEYVADRCLEALRAVRPIGPYCLGGYSLAGLVAFEMARRLRQQGEEVPLVALIDTAPPSELARSGMRLIETVGQHLGLAYRSRLFAVRSWAYLLDLCGDWRRFGSATVLSRLRTELSVLKRRLRPTSNPGVSTALPVPQRPETRTVQASGLPDRGSSWRYTWAVTRFSPQACPGKVTVLLSRSTADRAGSGAAGWERWAEAIEVVPLPGNHHSVIRQHRDVLAASLARCYHAALNAASGPEVGVERSPK